MRHGVHAQLLSLTALLIVSPLAASADPLNCNLSGYRQAAGLVASQSNNLLTVTWDGDRGEEVRLRFSLVNATPTVDDLSVRRGAWVSIASGLTPEFRVTSGLRRISNQQLTPLRGLNAAMTDAEISKYRWEPFWDAPLDLSTPSGRGGNPPPADGVANSPGLPRRPEEITRATASYRVSGCTVRTNGARLEVSFPGVQAGVFNGALQYSIFKGTNLIQVELLATTTRDWVAYKYDAGLKGFVGSSGALVQWRDNMNNTPQTVPMDGAPKVVVDPQGADHGEVPLKTNGRIVVASRPAGSVAVFPPPHNFFWAREIAVNLGYNWYRRDANGTFAIGIRQADHEDESENQANFALYSARPNTTQHMTMFLYPTTGNAYDGAMAFTHGDKYKPLAGYQVMNHHYHMDLGQRLLQAGSLDAEIPDLVAIKALGINIVSQIDSVTGGGENTPAGAVYPGATQPAGGRGANPGAGAAPAGNAGRGAAPAVGGRGAAAPAGAAPAQGRGTAAAPAAAAPA
ncbi:MAG TPA: hypothetical protein VJP86_06280, partial [Vicinamibacterales bacterium]|nr:hypothetical protein [Vicinamibacterales bacterium]